MRAASSVDYPGVAYRRLIELGISLSAEHNYSRLLEKILLAAKEVTGADGGTLYLLSEDGKQLRFAIMRNWSEVQHISFDTFVAPDRLHMNDWGYGCVAKLLAGAIAEAATRPITSAAVHPAPTSAPAKPGAQ